MPKISIPTEFTLTDKDKEYCDHVFKTYQELFHLLSIAAFNVEQQRDALEEWLDTRSSRIPESIFQKELNTLAEELDNAPRVLKKLTCSFVDKIEYYFAKKYGLKFSVGDLGGNDYLSLHSYDPIIWQIKDQVGALPEKDDE